MSLPKCDCTARCGDDSDIDRKKCVPCDDYQRRRNLIQQHQHAQSLVSNLMRTAADPIQIPRDVLALIDNALKHSRI